MTTALFELPPRPAPVLQPIVLAIDPGPELSAWVRFLAGSPGRVLQAGKQANADVLAMLTGSPVGTQSGFLVIEQIAAMGMAVGAETFETVFWSGRFAQAWGRDFHRVKRHQVKMHLCGNMRAKDPNIRQALIDRFGATKERAIGTKKAPGPLYGISGDEWAALAVAVTWADQRARMPRES